MHTTTPNDRLPPGRTLTDADLYEALRRGGFHHLPQEALADYIHESTRTGACRQHPFFQAAAQRLLHTLAPHLREAKILQLRNANGTGLFQVLAESNQLDLFYQKIPLATLSEKYGKDELALVAALKTAKVSRLNPGITKEFLEEFETRHQIQLLPIAAIYNTLDGFPPGFITTEKLLKRNEWGANILHIAAANGSLPQIEEFLTVEILKEKTEFGSTPWHIAIAVASPPIPKLAENLFDPETLLTMDQKGKSVLQLAQDANVLHHFPVRPLACAFAAIKKQIQANNPAMTPEIKNWFVALAKMKMKTKEPKYR
jgi:hypothetical protein